ncbi:hypothetical protein [Acinetobacter sp. CE-15]|uniref:hypothetical protein n=1 Tax=Acinetobacter sp. CE-15 TaxID=3425693 RepID=UPI003DA400DB
MTNSVMVTAIEFTMLLPNFIRDSQDILVDFSLLDQPILKGLNQLTAWQGKERTSSDNEPKYLFISLIQSICTQHEIEHVFIQHGNP